MSERKLLTRPQPALAVEPDSLSLAARPTKSQVGSPRDLIWLEMTEQTNAIVVAYRAVKAMVNNDC
jgi:hypothetical protein